MPDVTPPDLSLTAARRRGHRRHARRPDNGAGSGGRGGGGGRDGARSPRLHPPPGYATDESVPPEIVRLIAQVRPVVPVREREGLQVGVTRLLDYQDCARTLK